MSVERRRLGLRHTAGSHAKTQGADSHLHAGGEASGGTSPVTRWPRTSSLQDREGEGWVKGWADKDRGLAPNHGDPASLLRAHGRQVRMRPPSSRQTPAACRHMQVSRLGAGCTAGPRLQSTHGPPRNEHEAGSPPAWGPVGSLCSAHGYEPEKELLRRHPAAL